MLQKTNVIIAKDLLNSPLTDRTDNSTQSFTYYLQVPTFHFVNFSPAEILGGASKNKDNKNKTWHDSHLSTYNANKNNIFPLLFLHFKLYSISIFV